MRELHLMCARSWFMLTLLSYCTGARILAIAPFAFKSHQMFIQSVLRELAYKGHEVVVYSPFPQQQPVPNYIDVHVNTSYSDNFISYDLLLESFETSKIAALKDMWMFFTMFEVEALQHENIQKLAKSEEKFDLVITETFMGQEAFLAFGYKFNAPTIAIQSISSFNIVDKVMGNTLALSYNPDMNSDMSDKMTFLERLTSIYSIVSILFSFYYEHIPSQQAFVNQFLNFPHAPQLSDMVQNISLVLFNHHPTISYPRPFPPNFIPLGGIHLSKNRKPLPKDIQMFMEKAKHGVVYFSLGTVVPDNQLPKEFYTKFMKVFEKLKQKVLWKTKLDNIQGIPDNVMIVKWVPQQDVLAHPNCVLFITHGGLLSQQEVIYAGVPVVAIPFFADQPFNVRFYEEKGVGVKLDFLSLSEETISTAINTVLSNPTYKHNALQLSKVARDVPMSPAESAVFWVEYVLRHKGAHHLRPASAHMPWYQLALLDVLGVVILTVVLGIVLICWAIRGISLKFRNPKKIVSHSKKIN